MVWNVEIRVVAMAINGDQREEAYLRLTNNDHTGMMMYTRRTRTATSEQTKQVKGIPTMHLVPLHTTDLCGWLFRNKPESISKPEPCQVIGKARCCYIITYT